MWSASSLVPSYLIAVGAPQAGHVTNGPRILYLAGKRVCDATSKVYSPSKQSFGRITSRYSGADPTAEVWKNLLAT